MKIEKILTPAIAIILIIGIFLLFNKIIAGNVKSEFKDIALYILGVLSGLATTVVQYYFGSSHGSSVKNDMLQNKINGEKK